MSDIKTSVDSGGSKDWLRVEKIEKIQQQHEELLRKEAEKKKPEVLLFAGFVLFIRKVLNFLGTSKSRAAASLIDSVEGIIQYLDGLKKILKKLADEDVSHNPEYVQTLSDAWHDLLDASDALDWWERKKGEEHTPIKKIIESIRSFPPKEEHSLGFYLMEFAGKEWLPFPFMDLLHTLHTEYQSQKEKSQLGFWITSLDSTIKSLSPKP